MDNRVSLLCIVISILALLPNSPLGLVLRVSSRLGIKLRLSEGLLNFIFIIYITSFT